jgi:hypothetical protein
MSNTEHPIRCKCGTLHGFVKVDLNSSRGICYCKDCQLFAHFLGNSAEVLDEHGGTEIVPTTPKNVRFTQGIESLASMRLSDKGLMRWYAKCCNTPIGNTPANYKVAYVGLVHSCLENDGVPLDQSFGISRMRVNTQSARGNVKLKQQGIFGAVTKFAAMLLRERFNGGYKLTPFFHVDSGAPIVVPYVLSKQEWQVLRRQI